MTSLDASGLTEPTVQGEGWLIGNWRVAMAYQYLVVCIFDFIAAPIMTAIINGQDHTHPWQSLTLQNGGVYHVAMGAIVGASVYMRSQEKLAVFNSQFGGGSFSQQTTTVTGGQSQPPYQPPPRPPMPPAPPQPPISDDAALKAADAAIAAQTKAT